MVIFGDFWVDFREDSHSCNITWCEVFVSMDWFQGKFTGNPHIFDGKKKPYLVGGLNPSEKY